MENFINKLYCMDNLELLKQLPDNSIDIIYSDILYATGRNFDDYQDLPYNRKEVDNFYIPRIKEMHRILKPNGTTFSSEKLAIIDNKVVLTIKQDFIDEITEVGTHLVQIQLWDTDNGRVTLPPINFEVLEPIF